MAHKGMLNPKGTFFRPQVSERVGKSNTFWFYDSGGPCARSARERSTITKINYPSEKFWL